MTDLRCPYCKHEYDHNGDFEGLNNNNELCEYCPECDQCYRVYVDFYPSFSRGYAVDCWNGKSCNYVLQTSNNGAGDDVERHQCEYCRTNKWIRKNAL